MHEGQTLSWTLAVFCQEVGTIFVPTTQLRRQRLQPAMLAQLETGELELESQPEAVRPPTQSHRRGAEPPPSNGALQKCPRGGGRRRKPPIHTSETCQQVKKEQRIREAK